MLADVNPFQIDTLPEMPKVIPIEEKRDWLRQHDGGKSIATIAENTGRDKRTIEKGIEQARYERTVRTAKEEIVKEALLNHQQQLLKGVDSVVSALQLPLDTLNIELPIQLTEASITFQPDKGLVLDLHIENTVRGEMLWEHLKRSRAMRALRSWKKAMLEYIKSLRDLEQRIKWLLQDETKLPIAKDTNEGAKTGYISAKAIDELFYPVILRRTIGVEDNTNPEKRIACLPDGDIRHGSTVIAFAPDNAEKCSKAIIAAFADSRVLPRRGR